MKLNLDRIIFYLFYAFLIEFIICTVVIILLTYGIRINRKYEYNKEKFEIVQYEQVYHVFMPQEIFLEIENKSDKMIGTITIKERNYEEDFYHRTGSAPGLRHHGSTASENDCRRQSGTHGKATQSDRRTAEEDYCHLHRL